MNKSVGLKIMGMLLLACLSFIVATGQVRAQTALLDTDSDGLSDEQEALQYHTNPALSDTDGDTYPDGDEIRNGYSPHVAKKKLSQTDYDKDGLNDEAELGLGTNLADPDSDADSHRDGAEVEKGFNPLQGNNDRSLARHVQVDLSGQKLHYYLNNVKVGTLPVSTGLIKTPTPTGEFKIMRKLPVHHYKGPGYDLPNTKWNLEFKRSFYLHGAYWHNQFGKRPMSHGCVNIGYKDAEKLYAFLDVGDKVLVVGKTPRGAIAQK